MGVSNKSGAEYKENIVPFIPNDKFYFTKGVEAFERRKFDAAVKWLRKAVEFSPDSPLYQCQLSVVYTEIGAYEAANQLLHQVLQTADAAYADCYYLLANNYAHLGLLNDAKDYARYYLNTFPEGEFRTDAEHLLTLMDSDESHDDEWEFEEEEELLVYQEAVFQHMENEEWREALPLLEEMLSLFPGHEMIEHDYAYVLFFYGATDKAVQRERAFLLEHPDSINSRTNLAIFYYQLGRMTEYQNCIMPLLNVYPIHVQQKLRVAVTLARTGIYEDAFIRFQTLNKQEVKQHLSYYKWYSMAAYQMGRVTKAASLWEEGCHKHPVLADQTAPWNL